MVALATYGVIAVAGVAGGLALGRLLSTLDVAPDLSFLDRVAVGLATLFADEVLPVDATDEDRTLAFKNAIATAGLGVAVLVVVALGTSGPLAVGTLVGGGFLIVLGAGQALVVHGDELQSTRR